MLSAGLIRDLVFEDTDAANSPVFECLRDHGYEIFGLAQAFLGVSLVDPLSPRAVPQWDAPNYPGNAGPAAGPRAMRRPGWQSLRSGLVATDQLKLICESGPIRMCRPLGSSKLREMLARSPITLASIREPGCRITAPDITIVLSISVPMTTAPGPIDVYGPMNESSTMAPSPITAGPWTVLEETRAEELICTRPSTSLLSPSVPRTGVIGSASSMIWLPASSSSVVVAVAPVLAKLADRERVLGRQQRLDDAVLAVAV